MKLPFHPPLAPMEALAVDEIPTGGDWQYEPKWDGFRCLAFREGAGVDLQSKSSQPLARYFPEVVAAVTSLPAKRFVLDGELAIPVGDGFSFDALLQRIHPAASRVKRLSMETPAIYIVFDLLALNGESLLARSLTERRAVLDEFAGKHFKTSGGLIRLSPITLKLAVAKKWLGRTGATLDGIIAKSRHLPYRSGERDGMQKIKNYRSADCVVGGFRYGKDGELVGSLLLGLYDDAGLLHHVGFSSAIPAAEKPALTKKLERLVGPPGFTGTAPGGASRWNGGEEKPCQPLKPKLVVEVSYDHVTGGRFRHGTRVLRWRPDKLPKLCTMAQISQASSTTLSLLQ